MSEPVKLTEVEKARILNQVFRVEADPEVAGLPDVLDDTGDMAERQAQLAEWRKESVRLSDPPRPSQGA